MTLRAYTDALLQTVGSVYLPLTEPDSELVLWATLRLVFHDRFKPAAATLAGFLYLVVTKDKTGVRTIASCTRTKPADVNDLRWITVSRTHDFQSDQVQTIIMDTYAMMRLHACALFGCTDAQVGEYASLEDLSLRPSSALPPATGPNTAPQGDWYDMQRLYRLTSGEP